MLTNNLPFPNLKEEPTNRGTKDSQSDDEIEEDDMTEWEKKFLEVENDTLYAITRVGIFSSIYYKYHVYFRPSYCLCTIMLLF